MRKTTPLAILASAAMAFVLTAPVAAPAFAQMVEGPAVTWNFSAWGKRRAFTEGIEALSAVVKERTGGKFNIKIHYGEAISKSRENLDGIKIGAVDAAHFCNFYHPGKNPAFMVFSLPFLPLGDWDVSVAVREALFDHPALKADMDRWNAMAYASTLLPQYEFLGRGDPPTKLGDWKGRRVRAGGGIGDAMERLGAVKTTLTATEVYTAVQRGTLDAASFPYTYSHVAYKIHEVTDWYTSNMSPGTSECPIVFSKTSWGKLPEQYQELLMDLRDDVFQAQINAYVEIDKKNLPMLEKKLKKIVYSDEQLEEFRKIAGKPVWDDWVASNKDKFDAQGVLDLVFETAAKANEN